MKYLVTDRNDDILGPHSPEEIAGLLASGAIEPAALCCKEGADSWAPLDSILPADSASAKPSDSDVKPAEAGEQAKQASPEPVRDVRPSELPEKLEMETEEEPAAAPHPGAPARPAGANPAVVLCVLLVLALILFGAYYLGSRL